MKFMTTVAMVDPSLYLPLARAAEEAGYDSVNLAESVCYPRESDSTYPYTPDGSREFLANKPFLEPLTAMAAMGAVTSRIEFHTSVMKLPLRHPVIMAKEATSAAVITGNRCRLGVGTSPWPDDYEVVGLPWAGRGRRFEECIEIIRGLSSGEYFEYHGDFYDFPAIKLNPAPTEPIPILIGGHSEANILRAARIGDGWIAAGMSFEQLEGIVNRLNELRRSFGREHLPFEIHATTLESFTPDGVMRLEDLGVTHTAGGFGGFNPYQLEEDSEPLEDKIASLHRYADDVIARIRA